MEDNTANKERIMDNKDNTLVVAGVTAAIVSLVVACKMNRKSRKTLEARNAKMLKQCKKAERRLEQMMDEARANYKK
jgi:uncharacterized membrane protein